MSHYSGDDQQPQLQWLEDLIHLLLYGLVSIFVTFWRTIRSIASASRGSK